MTAPFTSMQAPQISERCESPRQYLSHSTDAPPVCSSNADITIVSSDGVYFKVYRKNLEVHSDIFSDADAATLPDDGALVPLSEPAAVLELLFQYMRRQLPPDLQDVDFATCAALAEAAEKYWVYSALSACREKMKEAVKEHPLEILEYAVRHGHEDLAAEAARNSVGLDALAAMECLSPDTFKAWIAFREQWQKDTKALLAACLRGFRYKSGNDIWIFPLAECIQDANPCYNPHLRSQLDDIITHADYTQRDALKKMSEARFWKSSDPQ